MQSYRIIVAKRVGLAVVLSIIISGLGQIYLVRVGRGARILIAGIGLSKLYHGFLDGMG